MSRWRVSNYWKKSCEEIEYYHKGDQTVARATGYRWGTFIVETDDDNPPQFQFDISPNGIKNDSINMYDCCVNNIVECELDNMDDGCWEEIDFSDSIDDDERERLSESFSDIGVYETLEENEGFSVGDCEAWLTVPILIEDEKGNKVKIITVDDEGNIVDYEDDE